MAEVTDAALLAQLNGGGGSGSGSKEVTDASLLAQLNGDKDNPVAPNPKGNQVIQNMGTGERFARGFAAGATNVERGIEQLANKIPAFTKGAQESIDKQDTALQSRIDADKKSNAPLLDTPAGKIGEIGGNMAATGPAALIPGGGTLAGAAAVGAGLGALQPTATGEDRVSNVVSGAAGGALGKVAGSVVGKGVGLVADKVLGRTRVPLPTSTASRFIQEGGKLPPSMAAETAKAEGRAGPKLGLIDNLLEGTAGKTKLEQAASAENPGVINSILRRGLGLGPGEKLTAQEIDGVRTAAGQQYDVIKNFSPPGVNNFQFKPNTAYSKELSDISNKIDKFANKFPNTFGKMKKEISASLSDAKQKMTPEEAVEFIKELRNSSSLNVISKKPSKRALGYAQRKIADAVDDKMMEPTLKSFASPEVYNNYIKSRELIAKSYDVRAALVKPANGNIDPVALARVGKKRGLTNELSEVAEYGQKFSGALRDISQRGSRPGADFSKLDVTAGVLTAAGGHAGGLGKMVAGALLSAAPKAARKIILSNWYQKGLIPKNQTLESVLGPKAGAFAGGNAGAPAGNSSTLEDNDK